MRGRCIHAGLLISFVIMIGMPPTVGWMEPEASVITDPFPSDLPSCGPRTSPFGPAHALTLPLRLIYRHGPSLMGGWEGLGDEELCARLINGREHWLSGPACACLIARKEDAWIVGVLTAGAVMAAAAVLMMAWARCSRHVVHVTMHPPPALEDMRMAHKSM